MPLINALYLFDSAQIFLFTHMVRNSALGKLRMRKQNFKKVVTLDIVINYVLDMERRTQRCCPRFRPGDRFCELLVSYT